MSEHEMEQARAKVMEVLERARRDHAYAQQVKADPAAALRAVGVPDSMASKVGSAGAVAAAVSPQINCGLESTRWTTTCWWTYTLW